MRNFIATSALGVSLLVLSSCGGTSVTKADLKTFKLRDLKVWGTPAIVKVDESTLQKSEDFLAYYNANDPLSKRRDRPQDFHPVSFTPPALPDAATAFDGSLLPPKSGGGSALLNVDGEVPGAGTLPPEGIGAEENFSIE